jgi:hypothetical protein
LDKKSIPMVAWYVLSKESYMNRVIREVFPTGTIVRYHDSSYLLLPLIGVVLVARVEDNIPLCSPKNTNLYIAH